MKTKIALCLAAALCVGGAVLAKVPVEEAALGGVAPGMSPAEVIDIYGTPTTETPVKYEYRAEEYRQTLTYGDSVTIYCASGREDVPVTVDLVKVSANNGFTTPAGLHVGSTRQEVLDTYGKPDIGTSGRGNTRAPGSQRRSTLWYKAENGWNLVFELTDNVVTGINVGKGA